MTSAPATLALLETVSPVLDVAGAGRYEIQRPIGHGGHAEVLLGIVRGADGFERPVAIKRMRTDQADPVKLVALIEEAHHAARLAHPNVVSVLDLARDAENRPYLVMEHVDGIDLATLIETGPLPHPVAIFVVRELLSGLGYIHEDEVEDAARRLVALRNWGVSEGAKRLKITHGALSRWTRRRKIPT